MIKIEVEVDGVLRTLETTALLAADLQKPLAIWGGYMRKKAIAIFKAQNFSPLAPATLQHRAARGIHKLEQKLGNDLGKAVRREEKTNRRTVISAMMDALTGKDRDEPKQSRGVTNRAAVLQAFQQNYVQRISQTRREGGFQRMVGAAALDLKQELSLVGRAQRAVFREVEGQILGKLPRGIHVFADADTVRIVEATAEKWTQVHNDGGEAGRGAREPERKTLELQTYDLHVLAAILEDHALIPWKGDK